LLRVLVLLLLLVAKGTLRVGKAMHAMSVASI
jgi:hypothetical protein